MVNRCKRIGLLWLLLSSAGCTLAVEEPQYEVLEKSGDFELRQYAPMIVAETVVSGSMDEASSKGFRLIADYIFGNNTAKGGDSREISMTAPVTMEAADSEPDGSKISMTAPVTMEPAGENWRVHFVMPSEYTMATLPAPKNDKVALREVPGKRYAVVQFSGLAGEDKVADKTSALIDWLTGQNLKPVGQPELARYDPPWTLPFLRRNEVMTEYQD